MSDAMSKDEQCTGCQHVNVGYFSHPCNECLRAFSGTQTDHYEEDPLGEMVRINQETGQYPDVKKGDEKQYLTKLIDDHWAYIEKLLIAHGNGNLTDMPIAEFHYKSAFEHGWKHAMEYMEGK